MKSKDHKDHEHALSGKSDTDIVKCASVNGKLKTEVISRYITTAWIGHKSSRKTEKTYAMLDSCSQGSFIIKERDH